MLLASTHSEAGLALYNCQSEFFRGLLPGLEWLIWSAHYKNVLTCPLHKPNIKPLYMCKTLALFMIFWLEIFGIFLELDEAAL